MSAPKTSRGSDETLVVVYPSQWDTQEGPSLGLHEVKQEVVGN